MITEDYCSYEVAKLLKEKGFDEKCPSYYRVQDSKIDLLWNHFEGKLISNSELNQYFVSAPTHQMAMKWLREEKGIYVYVEPYLLGGTYIDELEVHYCGRILDSNRRRLHSIENRTSYTEAIEERIKYALKSLI